MKKNFLLIIFFLYLLFYQPFKVIYGQTPTKINTETQFYNTLQFIENITGINTENQNKCGIASDPTSNICCTIINQQNDIFEEIKNHPLLYKIKSSIIGQAIDEIFDSLPQYLGLNIFFPNTHELPINPCLDGKPSTDYYNDPNCICLPIENQTKILCEKYLKDKPNEYNLCVNCAENKKGVWTAIGCVEGDFSQFISGFLLKTALGFAGIFSFLCIIYSSFMMQSSQGNQEKLKKAQELLTSCIMGLIVIIFSVFILKLIGVNILQLPYLK